MLVYAVGQNAIGAHALRAPDIRPHAKGPTSIPQGEPKNGDRTCALSHALAAHTHVNTLVIAACERGRARRRRAAILAGRAWLVEYALPSTPGRAAGRVAAVVASCPRCLDGIIGRRGRCRCSRAACCCGPCGAGGGSWRLWAMGGELVARPGPPCRLWKAAWAAGVACEREYRSRGLCATESIASEPIL